MLDQSNTPTASASSVTVDLGDIEAFSRFLSLIADDIDVLATETAFLISAPDFGEYDQSPSALTRYQQAATEHRDFITTLATRSDTLVAGTVALAQQYRDLEDLNASNAAVITSALGPTPEG